MLGGGRFLLLSKASCKADGLPDGRPGIPEGKQRTNMLMFFRGIAFISCRLNTIHYSF